METSKWALLGLAALGVSWQQRPDPPFLKLKEEAMTIEYTPCKGEAVVIVQAESEVAMGALDVRSPQGDSVIKIWGKDGQRLSLSGFVLESEEMTTQELFQIYREGVYDLQSRSVEGKNMQGDAYLSHALLPEPDILFPKPGSEKVSPDDLTVRWTCDPDATSYKVVVEQDGVDKVTVCLPAGSSSVRIPTGILAGDTETLVEVGAIAANGNSTYHEIEFQTR